MKLANYAIIFVISLVGGGLGAIAIWLLGFSLLTSSQVSLKASDYSLIQQFEDTSLDSVSVLGQDTHQQLAEQTQATVIVDYADAVALAEDSVVSIYTSDSAGKKDNDYDSFFGEYDPRADDISSGVVISKDGYIITNYHVIQNVEHIFIGTPRGNNRLAEVIGTDPETDLALLKADLKNPVPITFSDSDKLRNGDVVLAIGNPFGVGKTVTMGIVSALGRNDVGINAYEKFIQTDAAINPGNSGGALINTKGELVGINTAIVSNSGSYQGIAFALPSNQVQNIVSVLRTDGRVVRGWLGASFHTAFIEKDDRNYAEVVGLFKGGPAAKIGLAPGDLILQINGTKVVDASVAKELIAKITPGSPINLTIGRQGQVLQLTAISEERPSFTD